MFESIRSGNSTKLAKHLRLWVFNRSVWIGAVIVGIVVAFIEIGRRLGLAVPIPFLILLGAVVLVASIGGKKPGLGGAAAASFFIFYSMEINFGPATLTGGPIQVILGILLMFVVGFFLGRTRDQNESLIRALEETHADLERRVSARTAELSAVNERLNREIVERVQAEEALRANEIYYRSLIENTLDIVTVLNADGTIRYESPSVQRALGYEPEELIGRNVFDFIHPEDLAEVTNNFNRWREITGRSRILEMRFRHKDGSWRILEAIGNNLLADPNVNGAVINSRDITRRREMEKRAQRQDQLAIVGQLAAGIAHDFNNVMAVILLYAQMLGMSPNLTAKEQKKVKTIYDEGRRAADLIAQILDFGRQAILDRRPLDLLPFLEDFTKLLQRTLPDNIETAFECENDSYIVTADPGRIQQALINLAFNSRDAMLEGGRILIELSQVESRPEEQPIPDRTEGDWVKIILSDNGSGISDEVKDHLFEPFYTTKEPGKGTGLGLAQVYGIVKQHNGFIGVDSEVGKGSAFSIVLPLTGEGRPSQKIAVPDTVIGGHGELIVLVEDNDATRIALMSALESLNYTVKGAINGIEALVLLKRHEDEVRLVISDVVMPEMGGIALLDAMEKEGLNIPAILLTGNSDTEEMELVKSSGRAAWYMKPIPLEKLGKVVAGSLRTLA